MLCSYCQTEQDHSLYSVCNFCGAELKAMRPELKEDLSEGDSERSQPILATYHTYDLLVLLSFLRKERSRAYHLMRVLQRAPKGVKMDSGGLSFSEEEYRRYTARMRVVEEILKDRMGYRPKRVDQKLLERLYSKIHNNK